MTGGRAGKRKKMGSWEDARMRRWGKDTKLRD
jgi:hypothetical protein